MSVGLLLRKRSINPARLVMLAFEPFQTQFSDKQIQINIQIPHLLPDVECDIAKVAWVLTIFFSNALRYVPKWGKLKVVSEVRDHWLTISVENSGYGIPDEHLGQMFDAVEDIDSPKFGRSLALTLAQEIVTAHDGKIKVESDLGVGTRFILLLPFASHAEHIKKKKSRPIESEEEKK